MSDDTKKIDREDLLLPSEKDKNDLSMRDVRSLAFHFIYAMEQFNYEVSLESIIDNFKSGFDIDVQEGSKALKIARGAINNRDELDEIIKPLLQHWKLERLGLCTRLILRMAIWEMNENDTPPVVIINEAIELAKAFSEKDAYKFVNGVLDKLVNKKGSDEESI